MRTVIHEFIQKNAYGHIKNYIVPGLTSALLAEDPNHDGQKVRIFHSERQHQERITPHSHRFDLACCVMRGTVTNTLWQKAPSPYKADEYQASVLEYLGEPGCYDRKKGESAFYRAESTVYKEADWYFMSHKEIHSIEFSRDAIVLVIEGPSMTTDSTILEPVVNGEVVPTFQLQGWMFKKDAA